MKEYLNELISRISKSILPKELLKNNFKIVNKEKRTTICCIFLKEYSCIIFFFIKLNILRTYYALFNSYILYKNNRYFILELDNKKFKKIKEIKELKSSDFLDIKGISRKLLTFKTNIYGVLSISDQEYLQTFLTPYIKDFLENEHLLIYKYDRQSGSIIGIDNRKVVPISPNSLIQDENGTSNLKDWLQTESFSDFPILDGKYYYYSYSGFFMDNPINPSFIAKYSDDYYSNYLNKTIAFSPNFEKEPSIFDSKIGGIPYWNPEKINNYPRNNKGNPLILLCQINLSSELYKDPRLPKKGILQFFIDENWENNLKTKIVYHSIINNQIVEELLENIPTVIDKDMPTKKSVVFSFKPLTRKIISSGNKNSGMFCAPYFTQYNPIDLNKIVQEKYQCLLQLDSDHRFGLDWGDNGTCQWFIKEEDLKNLNFNNYIYDWACY